MSLSQIEMCQIEMQTAHSSVTDHKKYLIEDTTSCHESKILTLPLSFVKFSKDITESSWEETGNLTQTMINSL